MLNRYLFKWVAANKSKNEETRKNINFEIYKITGIGIVNIRVDGVAI